MEMKSNTFGEDVVVHMAVPPGLAPAGGAGSAGAECGRRLLAAARVGDTALVRALLARGAPLCADWLGTSALHLAAAHAHRDTVAVLLRAGVSRDARTKVERTPLHEAAGAGHAAVVRTLLAHGARADVRDMLGMTPLHWAVERGHAAAAAELLRAGADATLASKFLKTPLSLARDPAMRRLLEDALRDRRAAAAAERPGETERAAASLAAEAESEAEPAPEPRTAQAQGADTADDKTEKAARLLRAHGITLLPADDGSTVLSALQSGRTVVLSDAGKLMLRESGEREGANAAGATSGAGVVVRAARARSPPAPGVKVFALGGRVRALPARAAPSTARRAASPPAPPAAPAPPHAQPVKFLHVSAESRAAAGGGGAVAGVAGAGGARPAVKIVMNRANFNKLVASAARAQPADAADPGRHEDPERAQDAAPRMVRVTLGAEGAGGDSVLSVPEQFVSSESPQYLRAQLLCAHAALHSLRQELRAARTERGHDQRPH